MRVISRLIAALLVACFALAGMPAHAQQVSQAGLPPDGQRAVLSLEVNHLPQGDVSVLVRGDDVLLRYDELTAVGLAGVLGLAHAADALISLKSLAPKLKFNIDLSQVKLIITADPHFLQGSHIAMTQSGTTAVDKATGTYLNYSLQRLGSTSYATAEAARPVGAGTLYTSLVSGTNGRFTTNWTMDNPSKMRRTVIGDAVLGYGDLMGAGTFRGISVQRSFLLNPLYDRVVSGDLNGYVSTPTTADVYVNGVLVSQEQLPPGPFDIANIRANAGAANAEVVLHDAFGNNQRISSSFYQSTALLPKGMTDYAWTVGQTVGTTYEGHTGAFGRYDLGLSNFMTAGTRIAIASNLMDFGGQVAARSSLGELTLSGLLSDSRHASGGAGLLRYSYETSRFSFSASLLRESQAFSNIDFSPTDDKALQSEALDVTAAATRNQIFGISFQENLDSVAGRTRFWLLHDDLSLKDGLSLSVGLRTQGGSASSRPSIFANVIFPVAGKNESANAALQASGTSLTLTRGADAKQPLGYTVSIAHGLSGTQANYGATYVAPYGRYEFNSGGGFGATALTAAGGVVFIDHDVFFTQPVEDGYALVDTSGLAGVAVGSNGTAPVMTNRKGKALLINVPAYYSNTITIDPSKTPINYTFEDVTHNAIPSYRSGVVVNFRVTRIQSFIGEVRVASRSGTSIPAYGLLTLITDGGKGEARSDIGGSGEFYLQNVAPGVYPALIQYKGGRCSFNISIPNEPKTYVKLGKLTCAQ